MLAILSPGQGAQTPGCLAPWTEDPVSRAMAKDWLAEAGVPELLAHGRDAERDVVDTAIAQPLLVALGSLSLASLLPLPASTISVGHSIGEFTAVAAAGVLSPATAISLAAVRGAGMAAASAAQRSGMTAILGGDPDEVEAAVAAAGATIANYNLPGQVVAAGPFEALRRLEEAPPARARLRSLSVAGAFHTDLMSSAVPALQAAAARVPFAEPTLRWVSNSGGQTVVAPDAIRDLLVQQTTSPVRFDRCLSALAVAGVTATIELAPGGTLTAMVRRALPDIEAIALKTPDDLPAASELIGRHLTDSATVDALRLVVAPASGVWQSATQTRLDGDVITLGEVTTRLDPITVTAPGDLLVVEWLANDGDPVREGQPLARLAEPAL